MVWSRATSTRSSSQWSRTCSRQPSRLHSAGVGLVLAQHLCDDLVGEGCYHLQVGLHVGGPELAVHLTSVTGGGGGQAWHGTVTRVTCHVAALHLCSARSWSRAPRTAGPGPRGTRSLATRGTRRPAATRRPASSLISRLAGEIRLGPLDKCEMSRVSIYDEVKSD